MKFLDRSKIYVSSGAGGTGCLSFRREKYVEFGGPNGGDGGRGGHVFAVAVDNLNTLIDFRFRQHHRAPNGAPGEGSNKTGADGGDLIIKVPVGTQIFEEDETTLIADLSETGERALLAKGGNGGWGNARFKSSTNQAPRRANPGQPAEVRTLWLRLNLIADFESPHSLRPYLPPSRKLLITRSQRCIQILAWCVLATGRVLSLPTSQAS